MQHFLKGENIGLVFRRQQLEVRQTFYFVSNKIISDGFIKSDNKGGESIAPLYLYPEENQLDTQKRIPNLKKEIVQKIEQFLGLPFVPEKEDN